jgi:hypothetical protein
MAPKLCAIHRFGVHVDIPSSQKSKIVYWIEVWLDWRKVQIYN